MSKIDVTAIVNLHNEGYLAKPAFASVSRAAAHAKSRGYDVETVLILDRPDDATMACVEANKGADWRVCCVDYGETGLARNHGVNESSGKLVALLDGDDLWGENWLTKCIEFAQNARGRKIVWHPEINIYFGEANRIFRHIDMESEEFDLLDLAFQSLWTSLACGERSIFLDIPYPHTDLKTQIGHEDWSWYLRTIELGVIHKVIPDTGHAIRVKNPSISRLHAANSVGAVPHPTTAFRSLLRSSPRRPSDTSAFSRVADGDLARSKSERASIEPEANKQSIAIE
jgi:hypothetical protein